MRVLSSTLFAVVAKIKSSCACARWHIARTAVCCRCRQQHTVQKEARVPAYEGLDTDIWCYHKARLIWIACELVNDWLVKSLWKLVCLCMMSMSNATWMQCCALALLQLFVLGLNAWGAQKRDWSSLFWDDSGEANNDIWADGNNVAWLYIWGAYVCPHPQSNRSSWWIAIQSQSFEHFGATNNLNGMTLCLCTIPHRRMSK